MKLLCTYPLVVVYKIGGGSRFCCGHRQWRIRQRKQRRLLWCLLLINRGLSSPLLTLPLLCFTFCATILLSRVSSLAVVKVSLCFSNQLLPIFFVGLRWSGLSLLNSWLRPDTLFRLILFIACFRWTLVHERVLVKRSSFLFGLKDCFFFFGLRITDCCLDFESESVGWVQSWIKKSGNK